MPTAAAQSHIELANACIQASAGVADNICSNDCRQFALLTGKLIFPRCYRRS
jgi:hypothetical protein